MKVPIPGSVLMSQPLEAQVEEFAVAVMVAVGEAPGLTLGSSASR